MAHVNTFCKGREDVKEHATICPKEESMIRLNAHFFANKKSSVVNVRSPSVKCCRDKSTH
jgi:hypothetical protein